MNNSKNVCVVVLGDIGRSPRMQYHSISLAEQGHKVDIVCYEGTRPVNALSSQPLVSFHYLAPYPNLPCPRILNYAFKTIWQTLSLLFVLFIIRKPDYVLVQNPPAVPTLFVCWFFSLITKAKYIIDWHNYAHTIMALTAGQDHLLTKLTKKIEMSFGRKAHYNFCVTNAMRVDLRDNWDISAVTLYDKPPEIFNPITPTEKQNFLSEFGTKYRLFDYNAENSKNVMTFEHDRPGLLVSSTSWTEDEDFSILLKSLQDFEDHHNAGNVKNLPNLICVITGKGPLKQYYCDKIIKENWQHVQVLTPWLEAKDYPLLLACADLGVSLHVSSSGLDLPMKVVDMFGCGLPVCAYNFKCLHELLKHEENGFVFNNSDELSKQIQNWFQDYPNINKKLSEKFNRNLAEFQKDRWRENWKSVALHAFEI